MIADRAFRLLGIDPTNDGRVVRRAFVRLSLIYHPDRFVDAPEDVRAEAARRMKEVTAAYEFLRAERRRPVPRPTSKVKAGTDPWEEARRYRAAVDKRRRDDDQRRQRWRLWEELENEARERARQESELSAQLFDEYGRPAAVEARPADVRVRPARGKGVAPQERKRTLLEIRLEEARNGDRPSVALTETGRRRT